VRNYQGIGIGLPVCKKFIQALDGEIRVVSELKKGTRFIFSVPVD
jgi:signal transduction histidine kinase